MSACAQTSRLTQPLSEMPVIEATPLALLGADELPTEAHFRRDHFPPPSLDAATWALEVGGGSSGSLRLGLDELRSLPSRSVRVVLECAGHRRAEYDPPARGVQWGYGAMSEAVWTGVPLRELLELVAPRGVTQVVLEGADSGPAGPGGTTVPFARAIPIGKALDPDTLVALEMNGAPIPSAHGAPARAIVPGWYATDSVKWLRRIAPSSGSFDGHFELADYRLPDPAHPGGRRMTVLAVHSLLTSHEHRDVVDPGPTALCGVAWGGTGGIARVDVSIDGGPWRPALLTDASGPYARVPWSLAWEAEPGIHTVRVRASDGRGETQPDRPAWNERGFANSSIQTTAIRVRG